jgi:hypothetical protein
MYQFLIDCYFEECYEGRKFGVSTPRYAKSTPCYAKSHEIFDPRFFSSINPP